MKATISSLSACCRASSKNRSCGSSALLARALSSSRRVVSSSSRGRNAPAVSPDGEISFRRARVGYMLATSARATFLCTPFEKIAFAPPVLGMGSRGRGTPWPVRRCSRTSMSSIIFPGPLVAICSSGSGMYLASSKCGGRRRSVMLRTHRTLSSARATSRSGSLSHISDVSAPHASALSSAWMSSSSIASTIS